MRFRSAREIGVYFLATVSPFITALSFNHELLEFKMLSNIQADSTHTKWKIKCENFSIVSNRAQVDQFGLEGV